MKVMDIAEFKEQGFLEEVNRQFFHPLGLALAVTVHDDGAAELAYIIDSRDDSEGFIMGYNGWPDPDAARADAKRHAEIVATERFKHADHRLKKFGWVVQPAGVDANGY